MVIERLSVKQTKRLFQPPPQDFIQEKAVLKNFKYPKYCYNAVSPLPFCKFLPIFSNFKTAPRLGKNDFRTGRRTSSPLFLLFSFGKATQLFRNLKSLR